MAAPWGSLCPELPHSIALWLPALRGGSGLLGISVGAVPSVLV